MDRRWFQRSDVLIIAFFLLLAFCCWRFFFQAKGVGAYAEITDHGTVVAAADLNRPAVFSVPDHENVVFTVQNGAIAFTSSDCPDQICVKSGYLSKGGQMAACLPNGLTLRIVSQNDDVDAVAW